MQPRERLSAIHAKLREAFELVEQIKGYLGNGISDDTAFALGEALGVISKAKALVGRDIDHQSERTG